MKVNTLLAARQARAAYELAIIYPIRSSYYMLKMYISRLFSCFFPYFSCLVFHQNFDIRIDIGGEKCIESVHTDERENIVTFRYTGENGRPGDTAVYDFNQVN